MNSPPQCLPHSISSTGFRAREVLRGCAALDEGAHVRGLRASARPDGHRQVWARDAMIAALGASLIPDIADPIRRALRDTLDTLEKGVTATGSVPNNVDVATGAANYRAYADSGLWYVIGSSILRPNYRIIRRVLHWYACQDIDNTGLISIQEASDWQDLFCTRGKALTVNCLYVVALNRAAHMADSLGRLREAAAFRCRADAARNAINECLWYAGDQHLLRHVAHSFSTPNLQHDSLGRQRWLPKKRILQDSCYFLPYVSFRQLGEWFDTLGNLLAILSGVADAHQSNQILSFIERHQLALTPCKAIYPPVQPGNPDWRDYYGALNAPNLYHNGGVWPFIGGFYVAALVQCGRYQQAEGALVRLADLNSHSDFCEWCHGETVEPLGVPQQAWSAGMYVFAEQCVAQRRVPYFAVDAAPSGGLPSSA